ncbi:hypothetical protein QL285_096568 [Trifolium repens]|nr:hypothetical protein QL285_096568 [Trifolium repens]
MFTAVQVALVCLFSKWWWCFRWRARCCFAVRSGVRCSFGNLDVGLVGGSLGVVFFLSDGLHHSAVAGTFSLGTLVAVVAAHGGCLERVVVVCFVQVVVR